MTAALQFDDGNPPAPQNRCLHAVRAFGKIAAMKTAVKISAALVCAAMAVCAAAEVVEVKEITAALRERLLPAGEKFLSHDAILKELSAADAAADNAWRALKSREEYDAYRAKMLAKYTEAIGGLKLERTPLNAKVVEKIARSGYRIEKVIFESRPGVFVTGLLFLPDEAKFKPPYKGVIITCGHSGDGKGSATYQRGAVQGALAGFAVLIYDPISQGEREQVPGGFCCGPHNRYGALAALLGQSTAQQRIWDGMRCIDYLYTRDDLRKDGVGCMGNSGGGTMTSLLESIDPRIVAACPSCYISSLREVCAAIGPQDAEQNIFGQLSFGLNHAGYVLAGGNAVRMHCCFKDFFPIAGSRETYSVVTDTAKNCGLDATRYGITDVPGPHGWKESTRTSSVQWMRRWLALDENTPPIDVEACRRLDVGFDDKKAEHGLDGKAKNVTPGGKVKLLPGFKSIYDYLKDDLAAAEKARMKRDPKALAEVVCRRAGIRRFGADAGPAFPCPREVRAPETLVDGTTILREVYCFDDGQKVPALTFLPKGKVKGAIIVLDDRSDRAIHRMRVSEALAAGRAIMVADVACTGETGGRRHSFYGMRNSDEGPAVMLYLLGKSMTGVRAEELIVLADSLRRRTGFACEVVPHGRPCIAAAHAFAARRDLFTRVQCLRAPESWTDSVRKSSIVPFANVVNGALLDYDWTGLLKGDE
jgi:dienelactone hydrolase